MSPITTHVLDTALGCPAADIPVTLEYKDKDAWTKIGSGTTNGDGRVPDLLQPGALSPGHFRITFSCKDYLVSKNLEGFYEDVPIEFHIKNADQHYHVPLLLSPFGYSTYRGS
jgi:5-hydroxyisourate hydrolase